jgi:hypothetical protein
MLIFMSIVEGMVGRSIFAASQLVVIPGTYVYMVPAGIDAGIFFYSGYWYRPYEDHWYRARSYNGPWNYCPDPRVPSALLSLPPDYHNVPQHYARIPWGDVRNNWGRWERDHHWNNDRDWREGWRGGEERHEEHARNFDHGEHGGYMGHGEHGHDGH